MEFDPQSTQAAEFVVGGYVLDDDSVDLPHMIVAALEERASEYVVSVSTEQQGIPNATIADQYPRVPGDDPCYALLSSKVIRDSFPGWPDQTPSGAVVSAYRAGSFTSVVKVRPETILTPLDDLSMLPDVDQDADADDTHNQVDST